MLLCCSGVNESTKRSCYTETHCQPVQWRIDLNRAPKMMKENWRPIWHVSCASKAGTYMDWTLRSSSRHRSGGQESHARRSNQLWALEPNVVITTGETTRGITNTNNNNKSNNNSTTTTTQWGLTVSLLFLQSWGRRKVQLDCMLHKLSKTADGLQSVNFSTTFATRTTLWSFTSVITSYVSIYSTVKFQLKLTVRWILWSNLSDSILYDKITKLENSWRMDITTYFLLRSLGKFN